jgi:hypothetical protein
VTGDVRFFEELEEEAERRLREEEPEAAFAGSLHDELRDVRELIELLAEKVASQDEKIAELKAENRTLREIVGTLDPEISPLLEYEEHAKTIGKWAGGLEHISARQGSAWRGGGWVMNHKDELEKLLDGPDPDPSKDTEDKIAFLLRALNTPEKPALARPAVCEMLNLSEQSEKTLFRHLRKTGWFVLRVRDPRKRPGAGNPQILTLSGKGRDEATRRN